MTNENVIQLYDDMAGWFDTARNKTLVEKKNLDFIISRVPRAASVLDLGCGTAEPVAHYLIENGFRVTGIDGSTNMIGYCRRRFPSHRWLVKDMRDYNEDRTFDVIIAWDSFFHLSCDDQRAMFPRFERLSASGTCLMFSCGDRESAFWAPMRGREEVDMFHASLGSDEYAELLDRHGFDVLSHQLSDPDCGGRTYWIAQRN